MTRVLVFSDSHGSTRQMISALEEQPSARYALFLGDGAEGFSELAAAFPDVQFYAVCGNCDRVCDLPMFRLVSIAGRKIYMTHGHTEGVKYSMGTLIKQARIHGADIALYGHTHISSVNYIEGLYLVNPGSVSRPRAGRAGYAVIDITESVIVPFIREL